MIAVSALAPGEPLLPGGGSLQPEQSKEIEEKEYNDWQEKLKEFEITILIQVCMICTYMGTWDFFQG